MRMGERSVNEGSCDQVKHLPDGKDHYKSAERHHHGDAIERVGRMEKNRSESCLIREDATALNRDAVDGDHSDHNQVR